MILSHHQCQDYITEKFFNILQYNVIPGEDMMVSQNGGMVFELIINLCMFSCSERCQHVSCGPSTLLHQGRGFQLGNNFLKNTF